MIALALAQSRRCWPTSRPRSTSQRAPDPALRELQRTWHGGFVSSPMMSALPLRSATVAVMYAGRFVETGSVRAVMRKRAHP
jgi:ABC-type glutathione transport system ATPase component